MRPAAWRQQSTDIGCLNTAFHSPVVPYEFFGPADRSAIFYDMPDDETLRTLVGKMIRDGPPHTGDHKAGTHAFRRLRNTYLRNETSCPKGLRDFWLGHTGNTMDDLYDMVKDNAAFRKQKAEEYGVGFELPASIVPNVPKNRVKVKRAKAA